MTAKTIMLAIVCAVAMAGLLGPGGQPSSGQQGNRKTACGCYVCDKLLAVNFDDPPTNCYGILGADACTEHLERMPPAQLAGFCRRVKAKLKFDSFADSCPGYARYCEPGSPGEKPPEKKCEKPTPWFGGDSSKCSEVQSPVVGINGGAVTVVICGYPVFRGVPIDNSPMFVEAYRTAVRETVITQVGSRVCCDKFREAARTGTPCYPGADIDCDGIPNTSDVSSLSGGDTFPAINNLFSRPEGPIDPFPPGLNPDDPGFLPPQDKCDCKWELVKGKLNCSPDGRQRHYYEAKWRCPSTGNGRYTRKFAPATAPCP